MATSALYVYISLGTLTSWTPPFLPNPTAQPCSFQQMIYQINPLFLSSPSPLPLQISRVAYFSFPSSPTDFKHLNDLQCKGGNASPLLKAFEGSLVPRNPKVSTIHRSKPA
ncbi:unnamed protein product [Gulo gulo]|uniref:Uncharacterized protein n=1 Tax=Gulo gulo TaxID=48420 RepID=A0A9X9PWH2_GULGU|nr:unnamed protein product [Gulo gulo]